MNDSYRIPTAGEYWLGINAEYPFFVLLNTTRGFHYKTCRREETFCSLHDWFIWQRDHKPITVVPTFVGYKPNET